MGTHCHHTSLTTMWHHTLLITITYDHRLSLCHILYPGVHSAGEKETRAWTIRAGMTAPQAAGVIHSDIEKGFIRAETIAYSVSGALWPTAAQCGVSCGGGGDHSCCVCFKTTEVEWLAVEPENACMMHCLGFDAHVLFAAQTVAWCILRSRVIVIFQRGD